MVWEGPLRLGIHFQSNLISLQQLFSFKLWVMDLEQTGWEARPKMDTSVMEKKEKTQEERWRKIRDIEWWCQESRGTFVQCLPSFQESQRGYLLSTEDCHDFMNLENMGIVLNSCAGEVGCLGDLTHHLGLSCPVWGPMPPSEPYSSSYKSQSGMTNVQHMCHAPRLPQADDRHYESWHPSSLS